MNGLVISLRMNVYGIKYLYDSKISEKKIIEIIWSERILVLLLHHDFSIKSNI
nr:MAG TPA: hypothetical protein [Caudoviricetes sp.]